MFKSQYNQPSTPPDKNKLLRYAADLCSKKEYCSHDIYQKLITKGLPEKESAEIIKFLIEKHFIDDTRFALFYTRDKFRFNRWGAQKIRQMLRMKGINDNIINNALEQFSDDENIDSCLSLLKQKKSSVRAASPYEERIKLTRFAVGRGFSFDVINRALNKLGIQSDDDF